ncbi:hypothetical protein PB2503_13124 [Parvularcula bermudensis HTCC2503]|uniref:Uncharacterized protein n=1 Tax=Parvularcula bermudensis (strain ATCC BAA-594 / HTCC2503 / KCTC 12087) TaxID=314260 RepID=E0TGQ3_PARBH|nr:hypothetical protein PB2503_13124 [Parvularcula bermudensis HTCC2503]
MVSSWPRRGRPDSKGPGPKGRGKTATLLGGSIFAVIVLWALWHGVVGPRVIAPTPGIPYDQAPAPDPNRAPPTEDQDTPTPL